MIYYSLSDNWVDASDHHDSFKSWGKAASADEEAAEAFLPGLKS